jgi:hypothetical protein
MNQRAKAIAVGVAFYVAFVMAFYGSHRLAFGDGGGPYPLWYSVGELIFNAAKAVIPGAAVGWLCRLGAVRSGAVAGGIGGGIEVLMLGALTGVPAFSEFPGRMAVATIVTVLTSAFTNAFGGAAGFSFGTPCPTGRARPAAD